MTRPEIEPSLLAVKARFQPTALPSQFQEANFNGYILHNVVWYPLRNLKVDIEYVALKMYGYFSISANRRETLKDFNHLRIQN